jgi:putative solute:sodium symporter small subunit
MDNESGKNYWSANIRLVTVLLLIWAFVSYGMGILLRPFIEDIKVGGVDLGFWMAQQGSIYVFIVLIFVYAVMMNGLDRQYNVEEE